MAPCDPPPLNPAFRTAALDEAILTGQGFNCEDFVISKRASYGKLCKLAGKALVALSESFSRADM